jgi:thiamine biosynthesis lipoprotein
VAIEDPLSPTLQARHVIAPGRLALATSGHTAGGAFGGHGVSHIIDPQTARPASDYAASVSVLAETGMEADAWATALLAMGPRGPGFAREAGLSALFILGAVECGASITTGAFSDYVLV